MDLVVASLTSLFADLGDREQVAEATARWLRDTNTALEAHLRQPLTWNEEFVQGPTMSVPPASYTALRLLCAHVQRPEMSWPDQVPPKVDMDPAWREISAEDFARCHFPQVVIPDLWLPGDFAFTMSHALPDGEEVILGSLDGLTTQLRQLNQQTMQLGNDAVAARLGAGVDNQEFVDHATYGLAVFLHAASEAATLPVPVRMLHGR